MKSHRGLVGFCLVLAGCVPLPAAVTDGWPSGLPSRAYYDRVWESDPDNREFQPRGQYLGWVASFYAGSALFPGWTHRQAELASALEADQARLAEPDLQGLGQLLSSEWAKDNRVRRVGTPMLLIWGRVLAEARAGGRLGEALEAIRADVRALLRSELGASDITRERYASRWTASP